MIGLTVPVAPASGATLAQKRAEAASAQKRLESLRNKAEVAAEAYNEARSKYEAVAAKVRATEAKVAKLKAAQRTLQLALGTRADAMYRSDGTLGIIEALLSAKSFEDLTAVVDSLQRASEQDAATVADLKATRTELEATQRELERAQADAAAQSRAMAQNKRTAEAREGDAARELAGLKSDIRKIIARQKAAEAAAARARAEAAKHQYDTGGDPPSSSKGALAVWWAMKALGSWYQWGASGPDRFDCSGLTMWAWGHAGVSLPHYSRAQYASGEHVARANLEPGDLVFFGNPIHHVGMYVGNGNFIEAPYTGARVRITSLSNRSDYVGATRP